MGFFAKLKTIVNIATLGGVTLFEKELEVGGRVVKVTIDVTNELVRIGDEIFRAVPGEALFPGLGPLAGCLKNEIEDELIVLSPLGLVPSITVFVDGALIIGDLLGVVRHRTMFDDEPRVAGHVFGRSVKRRDEIRLTNLAGLEGRPFTVPTHAGGATINLGRAYLHDRRLDNMPLLIHELTHVWQIQRALAPETFLCSGVLAQLDNEIGDDAYDYTPGSQWSDYGLEQQAHIAENWLAGVHGVRGRRMTLASPLFRYINGNIRVKEKAARTAKGGSVRTWLAEAHVTMGNLRRINPPRPDTSWF